MPVEGHSTKLADRIAKGLARGITSVFFREILVEGAEQIPSRGPLIYVMNHPNSMVDPVLVLGSLPRQPRFLARHGLWDIKAVRPFLKLAGSIPIYRMQDKGSWASRNQEAFTACHEALERGEVIAIFPEGMSHSQPAMLPLKTGVSRIFLGAEERCRGLGIRIIPIGLIFEARDRFRSRVLVKVGEPLDPAIGSFQHPRDSREARRSLNRRVDEALRGVTLNYRSWREARLLERAVDIFLRSSSPLPERLDLGSQFGARREFLEGLSEMERRDPGRTAALARAVEIYDRMLRFTGFRDEHVISSYSPGSVARYVVRTLGRLLLFLPLAAVGTILNWLPYRVTARFAGRYAKLPEQPATKKLFGGFFVYPFFWGIEAGLVGWFWGKGAAFLTVLLAPAAGYCALLFHEDRQSFLKESLIFLRLRTHRRIWQSLRERRETLSRELACMVGEYRKTLN